MGDSTAYCRTTCFTAWCVQGLTSIYGSLPRSRIGSLTLEGTPVRGPGRFVSRVVGMLDRYIE